MVGDGERQCVSRVYIRLYIKVYVIALKEDTACEEVCSAP